MLLVSRSKALGVYLPSSRLWQSRFDYPGYTAIFTHEIGNLAELGTILNQLRVAHKKMGNLLRAIGYFEQPLTIDRQIGNRAGEGQALGNLGVAYKNLGNPCHAIGYFEQTLAIVHEIGDRRGKAISSFNLARALMELQELQTARTNAEAAARLFRESGHPEYARRAEGLLERLGGRSR